MFDKTVKALGAKGNAHWQVADALAEEVPRGLGPREFDALAVRARNAKVECPSAGTLRKYRDVALGWPVSTRIDGVGFTAHREALTARSYGLDPEAVLRDLVKANGDDPTKVTVAKVKASIKAQRPAGTGPAPKPAQAATPGTGTVSKPITTEAMIEALRVTVDSVTVIQILDRWRNENRDAAQQIATLRSVASIIEHGAGLDRKKVPAKVGGVKPKAKAKAKPAAEAGSKNVRKGKRVRA